MIVTRQGLRSRVELPRMTLIESLSLSGELTPRDVLCLVAVGAGMSNRQLAAALGVHKSTIGRQIRNARTRAKLVL